MNMLRQHRNRNRHGLSCRNEFLFPVETHFNKIFDQFFQNDFKGVKDAIKASQGYPKMDVLEDGGLLLIKVAVPGMTLNDLAVEVEEQPRTVTISGKMAEEHDAGESATYHIRELRHSQFKRILQLPDDVEGDPTAELKDGILTLSWRMREAEPPPTKKLIEIKEG
jgi:HSP20 family protein